MAADEYQLPETGGSASPAFRFCIDNTLNGSAYSGDVELILTYDNLITY